MQLEVGNIVEGKVTGITKFGAFVSIPEGKTGMVHISEVSNSYVKEISDHLKDQQEVRVKIMSISEDGKISLSIKRCMEDAPAENDRPKPAYTPKPEGRPRAPRKNNASKDYSWQPKKAPSTEGMSFEDMMLQFKQTSNDRIGDLKKANDVRPRRRNSSH